MKLYLCVLVLLIYSIHSSVSAQEVVFVCAEDDKPISGILVSEEGDPKGITDSDGLYLVSKSKQDVRTISTKHLSYIDTTILLHLDLPDTIHLQQRTYWMPVVEFNAEPEELKGKEIVSRMYRAVKENYITSDYQISGIYREALFVQGNVETVSESVTDLWLGGYGIGNEHKLSWRQSWENQKAFTGTDGVIRTKMPSTIKFKHYGTKLPEGIQKYGHRNDRVRIVETRNFVAEQRIASERTDYPWFADGVLGVLTLDKLRLGYDFLNQKNLRKYSYTLADSVVIGSDLCYVVEFKPRKYERIKYNTLNQSHAYAPYSGKLYIATGSYGLVKFTYHNSREIIPNNSVNRLFLAGSIEGTVNYGKTTKNKYYLLDIVTSIKLGDAAGERTFVSLTQPYHLTTEEQVTRFDHRYDNLTMNVSYAERFRQEYWDDLEKGELSSVWSWILPANKFVKTADWMLIAPREEP